MELLEKHFDTAFAAPDGIKKLRELILTLAMQGKLVPQDPQDQSARELLNEIEAEKKRLVKEGKIKTGSREDANNAKEIKLEEVPYELPEGWEWVKFGKIAFQITDGAHHTPTYVDRGIPFLSVKDMSSGQLSFSGTRFISKDQHDNLSKRCHPEKGDLLLTKIGTTGVPVLVETDEEFSIFVSVALIKFSQKNISGRYLSLLVKSPLVKKQSEDGTEGVGNKNLVLRKINNFIFPLPPLAEQRRIVAKIDQLMARCDELEKLRAEWEQKRLTVHTAALNRLIIATENSDFGTAWHFITQHFGELYSVKENVTELRKAILHLAVMGKLVQQDSKDQPASELLKEIEAEKKRLVKEGKIKASEPFPEIKKEDQAHPLPSGWEWVRLGEIVTKIGSGSTPRGGKSAYVTAGIPFLRSQNIWNDGLRLNDVAFISPKTHELMSGTKVAPLDILLNITGASLGRCALMPDDIKDANVSQHVTIIRTAIQNLRRYIHLLLLSPYCQTMIWARQVGMAREGLSKKVFEQFEIPLPPLAEQHRIVAKTDQLMALCDELEQRTDKATGKRTALLNAVMAKV